MAQRPAPPGASAAAWAPAWRLAHGARRQPAAPVPRLARAPAVLLAWLLVAGPAATAGPADLTIYRCTGSDGSVTLGNTPCSDGEREQQRVMQRPQDPPAGATAAPAPGAAGTAAAPAATAPPRSVRVVRVRPPQPMYACTTLEGERYLSEEDRAAPRWVPLWVTGRAAAMPRWQHPSGPRSGRPHPGPALAAAGTWVQDRCERLPQEEVCRHLSDRRYEILRIYHAAMPSEREALDAEQAVLDARLAADCAGT